MSESITETDISRAGKTSTIRDVAARAGVSLATVSRFLNGGRVRQAGAIGRAIDELDFHPSALARSLKSGTTRAIGVVVPDITNPFFAAVVKGIESVTRDDEYDLLLCNTDESVDRERRVVATLMAKKVDGLLMAPATEHAEPPSYLVSTGVPTVFIDRRLAVGDFDSVLVDNEGGAALAARHLMSLGHERIAMVSGPLETTPGRGRYDGFVEAARAAGLELRAEYIALSDFREDGGYQSTLRLLAVQPQPTAIFVANNLMSMGALRAIHDLGLRIPDDISFLGFDDLDLAELLDPPLTVIDRPMAEQGVLAMRLLLSRMEHRDMGPPRTIRLETRLKVRASCAPPADRRDERHSARTLVGEEGAQHPVPSRP
jgi:LacI family transcriptional regulator